MKNGVPIRRPFSGGVSRRVQEITRVIIAQGRRQRGKHLEQLVAQAAVDVNRYHVFIDVLMYLIRYLIMYLN